MTGALIGDLPVGPMLVGTLYGAAFMPFAVAVIAAVAGFARSQIATVLPSLLLLLALPLIGMAPAINEWLPTRLLSALPAIVDGAPTGDYLPALAVTVVATAGLLALAVHRLAGGSCNSEPAGHAARR